MFYNDYLAYVNTNDDENPKEKWGSKRQIEKSFYLKSKGSSIKPDVLHDVVVSYLFNDKLENILLSNNFIPIVRCCLYQRFFFRFSFNANVYHSLHSNTFYFILSFKIKKIFSVKKIKNT